MAATMQINNNSITRRGCFALLLSVAWVGLSTGCSLAMNPFQDEMHPAQRVTTASVDGTNGHDGAETAMTRLGPAMSVSAKSGAVRHFSSQFEDPAIEESSDDGRMAWTEEDYVQFLLWQPARFLFETVTWPVQAAMDPPWKIHVSDGVLARQSWDGHHDAERDRG